MFFSIDSHSAVPIYEQIVRQVKLAVADGTLSGGQMLPSVRQLAREIALNPNTIARAYRELQSQQIVESLRGRGMVVRRDAIDTCMRARDELVAANIRAALDDALSGGMSSSQLREIFERALMELQSAPQLSETSSNPSHGDASDACN